MLDSRERIKLSMILFNKIDNILKGLSNFPGFLFLPLLIVNTKLAQWSELNKDLKTGYPTMYLTENRFF